jgi:hypothetical protein
MRKMMAKRRNSLSTLKRSTRICSEWDIRILDMVMSMMKRKRTKMRTVRMKTISIKRMSSINRMHLVCKFTIPEQQQDLLTMVEACLETN